MLFIKQKLMTSIYLASCFILLTSFSWAQQPSQKIYMTLEEAIQRALSRNNQLQATEFAYKKATWEKRNAWTQLLPTVTLNSRMSRIDERTFAERDFRRYMPPEIASIIPQTVFQQSYYTSLEASVPLFNGQILNGLFVAKANENMAGQLNESMRKAIIYQVVSAYLNVLKSKEILRIQEEYLDLSKRNYEKAERLYDAGRYSKTEALRWKVDYAQQKSQVVGVSSQLRSFTIQLKRHLNIDMNNMLDIEGQIPHYLRTESDRLASLSEEAILELIPQGNEELIRMNAALSASESGKQISKHLYRNAYSAYLPNVTANYSYGWRENNTLALDDYSPTLFMVNMSIPVFSGFQNLTSVKSAYYDYKQNQADFQDQLQNTRFLLTETVNRLINLITQKELSKTNTEYSEHNYRVVAQQKEKGLVSNIDFVDAKLNLQNAKLEEINTQYDFITAMVELFYLIGKIDSIIE